MSAPAKIKVQGTTYVMTLFKIETLDERGRPESLTVLHNDIGGVEISGGETFITGYVSECIGDDYRGSTPGPGAPKESIL